MPPAVQSLFTNGEVPRQEDILIALMGMTGSGKSSFISLCTEKKVEISHGLESCTQEVGTYSFIYKGLSEKQQQPEKRVFLIDTPGFDDSNRSDAEVLRTLSAWLTATFSNKIRLSGIIYLHRINQTRMQGSARKNVLMLKQLCGDDALKKVILVTTMWDIEEEETAIRREQQLLEKQEFWGYMASKGSEALRHNNTKESAMKIVTHFVGEDSKVTLEIQDEMVNKNKSLDTTAVGEQVDARLEQERAKHVQELREVEADLRKAISQKDQEVVELMTQLRLEYASEMQKLQASQEAIRISMEKLQGEKYPKSVERPRNSLTRPTAKFRNEIKSSPDLANMYLSSNGEFLAFYSVKSFDHSQYEGKLEIITLTPNHSLVHNQIFVLENGFCSRRPRAERFELSPDGSILACLGSTPKIYLLNLRNQSMQTLEFGDHPRPAFQFHGPTTFVVYIDYRIQMWDLKADKAIQVSQQSLDRSQRCNNITFSPDASLLGTNRGEEYFVYVVKDFQHKYTLPSLSYKVYTMGESSPIFSSDGLLLATDTDDRDIKIWDMRNGSLKVTINVKHSASPGRKAFLQNGLWLACEIFQPLNKDFIHEPSGIDIYDTETGGLLGTVLNDQKNNLYPMGFAPSHNLVTLVEVEPGAPDVKVRVFEIIV